MVFVKKTEPSSGTNGHVFALRQTFDSVRPFFVLVPGYETPFFFFPKGGAKPGSNKEVQMRTRERTGKSPTPKDPPKK